MTDLFIREGRGIFEQRDPEETQGRSQNNTDKEQSEAAIRQGLSVTTTNQDEARKDSFVEPSEGGQPVNTLILSFGHPKL